MLFELLYINRTSDVEQSSQKKESERIMLSRYGNIKKILVFFSSILNSASKILSMLFLQGTGILVAHTVFCFSLGN